MITALNQGLTRWPFGSSHSLEASGICRQKFRIALLQRKIGQNRGNLQTGQRRKKFQEKTEKNRTPLQRKSWKTQVRTWMTRISLESTAARFEKRSLAPIRLVRGCSSNEQIIIRTQNKSLWHKSITKYTIPKTVDWTWKRSQRSSSSTVSFQYWNKHFHDRYSDNKNHRPLQSSQSINQSSEALINQAIYRSINQTIRYSMHRSIDQSINQSNNRTYTWTEHFIWHSYPNEILIGVGDKVIIRSNIMPGI